VITKIFTATNIGLESQLIEVEVDILPAIPAISIVGLPDKAVQESKERIKSAIKQSGFEFPLGKVVINLAPAGVTKSGSSFDLPIALGVLAGTGFITNKISDKDLFLGELSLDGQLRPIKGVLTLCLWAKRNGYKRVFIPSKNQLEGSLVSGLEIYSIQSLLQLVKFLNGSQNLSPIPKIDLKSYTEESLNKLEKDENGLYKNDLAYIKGQTVAKRALEIAASGGHNVLFIGQPGSGKTLLAKSYSTILPKMTEAEILEVTQLYSIAGLLLDQKIIFKRPFRSPHHSSSHIALVGGGSKLRPGEISLAHRGVLFLDEFPEFTRETLEALRQPLEDGEVTISRASGSVKYPSRFYLLAAANPTPSGFNSDDPDAFTKPQSKLAIARYQAKFSGPILDRIDIQVEINRPKKEEMKDTNLAEKSEDIAKRVQMARDIQDKRFSGEGIFTNAEMNLKLVEKYCKLDIPTQNLLSQAMDKFKLSARSYIRVLKLSRTIADLANSENIQLSHLAEALQYRGRLLQ
jgi:magnesium chelatase family protein